MSSFLISIESTLIWFRHGNDNGNWLPWVERLEEHLKDYKNSTHYENLPDGSHSVECGPLGSKQPGTQGMCRIDREELFKGKFKVVHILISIFNFLKDRALANLDTGLKMASPVF